MAAIPAGRDVLGLLRDNLGEGVFHNYLHYSELPQTSTDEQNRIWACMKLRRAGTRIALPPSWGLSLNLSGRLVELMTAILSPLDRDLSLVGSAMGRVDRAESATADAIAVCRLEGVELDPVAAGNLLRTRGNPSTKADGQLLSAFQGLSLGREPATRAAGLHPLLDIGLRLVMGLREDRGEALLTWRQALRRLAVPGIDRLAPISHLGEKALNHALGCMESDENDATYPLLVVLGAVYDARRAWASATRARIRRLGELGAGTGVNERQALVLDQVAETPQIATSLAHHKQTFGVVYETARTDLQDLVRQGRLTMTRQGRAFVFTAGSGMPEPEPEPGSSDPAPTTDSLPVFY